MVSKKRSVVWSFFSSVDSQSLQCVLCKCLCPKQAQGATTSMLRHLRLKHPSLACKKIRDREAEHNFIQGNPSMMETYAEHSVEVTLEDSDSEHLAMGTEGGINSPLSGILQAQQVEQVKNEKADYLNICRKRKRSRIWRHFELLDCMTAVRCLLCLKKLQCSDGSSTGNLHRHISKRHPVVFSQLVAEGQNPRPSSSSLGTDAFRDTSASERPFTEKKRDFAVEESMEDEDSDTITTVNDADINSAITGILEAAQGGPGEQVTHGEERSDPPITRRRGRRSLIWKHFQSLDSLDAAQCLICKKKIQCFEGGSTSNLHRHMSKRHPGAFSQFETDGDNQSVNGEERAPLATPTRDTQYSGAFKFTRASQREKRALRRERELIEALRRAQKEEAQALELQRELIEKLHAVNTREAAAERLQIESLRKTQMEEAKDLSRQREELQKEKAELEKKWEELQQQGEEQVLFSRDQQSS